MIGGAAAGSRLCSAQPIRRASPTRGQVGGSMARAGDSASPSPARVVDALAASAGPPLVGARWHSGVCFDRGRRVAGCRQRPQGLTPDPGAVATQGVSPPRPPGPPGWLGCAEPLCGGGRPRAVGDEPQASLVVVHGRWSAVVGAARWRWSGLRHGCPPGRELSTGSRAGPGPLIPPHGGQPARTTSGSGRGALRRPVASGGPRGRRSAAAGDEEQRVGLGVSPPSRTLAVQAITRRL